MGPGGWIFFNRDGRKTRPVAGPASLYENGNVRSLSPHGPKGRGIWIITMVTL